MIIIFVTALSLIVAYALSSFWIPFFLHSTPPVQSYKELYNESTPIRQTVWATLVVLTGLVLLTSLFGAIKIATYMLLVLISMGIAMFFEKRTKVNPPTESGYHFRMLASFATSILYIFIHYNLLN